ncbi:MAG: SBBP repeat-containing protein [Candidatus Njordarchaeia archaeon]
MDKGALLIALIFSTTLIVGLTVKASVWKDTNESWIRLINISTIDAATGITTDSQGNIYIVGNTYKPDKIKAINYEDEPSDVFVAKIDGQGDIKWFKTIGGAYDDWGSGIAVDGQGDIYIIGYASSYFGSGFIGKLSASGALKWFSVFNRETQDLCVVFDGGLFLLLVFCPLLVP